MAVNFGLLQQAAPVSAFFQGQQDIRAEQDRNALRQQQAQQLAMQQENALALREQRAAQAAELKAKTERAAQRQDFLTRLGAKMAEGGYKLDRPTLGQVLQFGMQTGEDSLIKLATEGIRALDEEDLYRSEATRLGQPGAEGYTRPQVQQMIASPSARLQAQGKALAPTLPKDQPEARLQDRFVPVGKLVFDRQEQRWVTPPQAAIAATQDRAAPAAPAAPAPKPLTAQQETQRRDKLGKEFKAATNALQTTQDVLDSIQMVRDAPGLDRATGFTGVYTPSFSEGAAAQAETRFQNLKGKITALGKAQAAASGAIGSIANQEWKILADQIAALELVKGTGPLLEQLTLVEAQAQGAMERIRDAYQRQFGEDFERFPQFRDIPQPKSTVKGRKSSGAVTPAAPATGAFPAPPPAAIDALKRGQGTDEQFDAVFGPGAAARARGR